MKSFVKCAKIILMAILCLSLSLLYVACSNEDFKLSYTAGTGGIISGQTTQTVAKGKNGSEVVAIANTGYVFVKWSDGVTASSRTDKNVQNDVSVSAEFEAKNSNVELDLATAQTLYQFSIFDNQVTITKYIGSAAEVEIPSKIGGKPVVAIGSAAFEYCDSLTSITIPSSVTSIGDWAFSYCDSLTSITIPSSVTSIGNSAFRYCDSLTSIDIPSSVTSIGSSAFSYCDSLTSVTFSGNSQLTSIGDCAFWCCDSLTSITIPSSVTSIDDKAFYYCDSLTIYCEATSQPSGWDGTWNYSNRPVYWYSENMPTTEGKWWHYDDGVVTKW